MAESSGRGKGNFSGGKGQSRGEQRSERRHFHWLEFPSR